MNTMVLFQKSDGNFFNLTDLEEKLLICLWILHLTYQKLALMWGCFVLRVIWVLFHLRQANLHQIQSNLRLNSFCVVQFRRNSFLMPTTSFLCPEQERVYIRQSRRSKITNLLPQLEDRFIVVKLVWRMQYYVTLSRACLKVVEIQTVSDDFQTNSDTQTRINIEFQTI